LLEEAYGAEVDIFGGRTGSFEITAGDALVFSKLADHRFPEDDEIRHLLDGR
jgi:selT/selW/selH-like putative selenoprotein